MLRALIYEPKTHWKMGYAWIRTTLNKVDFCSGQEMALAVSYWPRIAIRQININILPVRPAIHIQHY